MAHHPGDQICGRFELVRAEAEGTGSPLFGDSWAAVDGESGEVVRLILLGPDLIPEAGAREALEERLAPLCERGQDDVLVPLSFVGRDGDHLAVAFEGLYAGIALSDVVTDLEVSDRSSELGQLIADLALGLAILHGRGHLHGSLGIETIFVWERGNALWQHGLAGGCDPRAIAGRVEATGLVVAPEVAAEGRLSPASDVFAWGSVIATYASGLPPKEALEALRRGEILGKSGKLLELLQAAVQPAPSERPADGSRLVEGLQAACLLIVDGEEDSVDDDALTALAEAGIDPVTVEQLPPEVSAGVEQPKVAAPVAEVPAPAAPAPARAAAPATPVPPMPEAKRAPTPVPPTASATGKPAVKPPPLAKPPKPPPSKPLKPPSLAKPPAMPRAAAKPPAKPPAMPRAATKPPAKLGAPVLPPRPPLKERAGEGSIPGIPKAPSASPAAPSPAAPSAPPVAPSPAAPSAPPVAASPAAPSVPSSPPEPPEDAASPIGDAVAAALGGALPSLGEELPPPYLPPIGEIQEPSGVRPAAVVVKSGAKADKEPEEGKKKIHVLEPSGSRSVSSSESSGGLKTSALVNMALAGGRAAGEASQRISAEPSSLADAVSAATAVPEPSQETAPKGPSLPDLPEVPEGGRDRRTHPLGWAIEDIEGHPGAASAESGAGDSAPGPRDRRGDHRRSAARGRGEEGGGRLPLPADPPGLGRGGPRRHRPLGVELARRARPPRSTLVPPCEGAMAIPLEPRPGLH